ncbi:hypothetical protein CUMW_214730 [Citrus unshiu]|uniref:Uncharacterized protein n=1 Tax=Citrus unshiu TaxID=55188 RepID=A0A2H5QBT1_CITUN|nr:hypothetical protein CUMW_214730 [Citrus unshiu]
MGSPEDFRLSMLRRHSSSKCCKCFLSSSPCTDTPFKHLRPFNEVLARYAKPTARRLENTRNESLEAFSLGTSQEIAKVLGTVSPLVVAMPLSFYKGIEINISHNKIDC